MKKIKALVGAGLLASAGTMLGVTCAVDNVPAATLLVPYFKVAAPVNANFTIGAPTVDTLLAITNVSSTGLIAHVTVWNKYSAPVVDYNIAMTGYDVATWSMSSVLGGELTPNYSTHEVLARAPINLFERGLREGEFDPCGVYWPASGFPTYDPRVGWGKTTYIRFPHPLSYTAISDTNADHYRAISIYEKATASKNAYCPGGVPCKFQQRVLASLDEGLDVTSFTSVGTRGGGILDLTNYASNYPVNGANDVIAAGPAVFQGYVTIDVVNYCTNWFPDQDQYYANDAIATTGWRMECDELGPDTNNQCDAPWYNIGYTPNALIGDYFFLDGAPAPNVLGNVSGDPMVGLEFDERLNREQFVGSQYVSPKTFYGRFVHIPRGATASDEVGPFGASSAYVPYEFKFAGDGREPLGERFGFRFLNQANSLETWLVAWRSSIYRRNATTGYIYSNLNQWLQDSGPKDGGFFDAFHALTVSTQDEDERVYLSSGAGCPSGDPDCQGSSTIPYIFLESQRIRLAGNREINPAGFAFGWIDMRMKTLPPPSATYLNNPYFYNQAFLAVEHSATGALISVGHAAHLLDGEFLCRPIGNFPGTVTPSRLFNPTTIPDHWDNFNDAVTRWYPGVQSLQFNRSANTNAPQGTYSPK